MSRSIGWNVLYNLAHPYLIQGHSDEDIVTTVSRILEGPSFELPPGSFSLGEWQKMVSYIRRRLVNLPGVPGYTLNKGPRGDLTSREIVGMYEEAKKAHRANKRGWMSRGGGIYVVEKAFSENPFLPENERRDYARSAADIRDSVARQRRYDPGIIDLDELGLGGGQ